MGEVNKPSKRRAIFGLLRPSKSVYRCEIANMVRVAADVDNVHQVLVYYKKEWYHYDIDTETGAVFGINCNG